jgi:hypothetical protein
MPRKITLHVFASAKGGVGKSTLAVTCAKLLAEGRDRVPVVIDADMTGTSLADGLRLLAPDATLLSDGTIDIEAAHTGRFLSRDEVKRRRRLRRDSRDKRGLPPPFLNDALRPFLLGKAEELKDLRIDSLLWRHEADADVWYLPSSALRDDVVESLGWFARDPYDWMGAMTVVLHRLSMQRPEVSDVVVDLPPGLFGFGAEMLWLTSAIQRRQMPEGYPDWTSGEVIWNARIYVVTTPDENDLLPVYENVALQRRTFGSAHVLVNKSVAPLPKPAEIVGETLGILIDERRIQRVPLLMPTLGTLFVEGALRVDDNVRRLAPLFTSEVVA